jgi:hypothetical protein
MNKLMTEDMDRFRRERVAAIGRAIRQEVPVENSDRDSSMDDVLDKLGRTE